MKTMKTVYVAHSREFDFRKELYEPLRNSEINRIYNFVLPHENSDAPFDSKAFLKKGCSLVIAEVSYPSTGLGIELGWANLLKLPIVCISRKGAKISGSLKAVCSEFIEYSGATGLIEQLTPVLIKFLSK